MAIDKVFQGERLLFVSRTSGSDCLAFKVEAESSARGALLSSRPHLAFAKGTVFLRVTLSVAMALCSCMLNAESVYVVDQQRDRKIPVEIYEPKEQTRCKPQLECPVAIISAGYGVSHTKYEFVAHAYAAQGYLVLAVRHELPADPPLSTSGDLYQNRMENWRRGAETIRVVASSMKNRFNSYNFDKLTLIGHSNGGDISAWLAQQDASVVDVLITLDHRRVPIPKVKGLRVLSLRAGDFPADEGVIPTSDEQASFGICIVEFPKALHNNMTDDGPEWLQSQIHETLLRFSSGESECPTASGAKKAMHATMRDRGVISKIREGAKMKTMNCKQLGGACETAFRANTFDEVAALSKQHGMEMYQKQDAAHLDAMEKMQELMKTPEAMNEWFESKRREFDSSPDV